ncbi:class II fructose-1,6-bisphosphate aldolase [Sporanaerobacter acetigenes]|uniref:Fructose-bisphosphate aldolase, class II n=1 Tax=Sporanaerobacter acetigenes DSM 13106 TaxID=1123281 RepID=A0A1M5SZQ4_9FIRM|nr:class II fructose-1,6-bisphosphate aldolase [Sporanaerobacter acetigenes]SHH44001.1 fructose-bisphosphate aldolase, class II [Sporanaerobacter acetigenes DSM 13106]
MLVTGKEILEDAHKNGYAVGAFNINNMEIIQAIIEAAEETKSPVILQASQGGLKYAGIEYIEALAKVAAHKAKVPVAIHLDHGTDFDQVIKCIRHGFSSVMVDGSKHPIEENIAITKLVVDIAHSVDVSVEGELGKIGGVEDHIVVDEREATFTDPDEAVRFVKETGVDSLAIAVGTAHGVYKGEPKLDFDRIKIIKEKTNMPLVLHGSSGVPYESLEKAVSLGINKINIDTDIRAAFAQAVKDFLKENPDNIDPRKILGPARMSMKEVVMEKMKVFGSVGRA